ncbi:NUDIX domain protein [uncultured archaeon]|nr:NUDIX domain protein [uncultured archaeon]
MEKLNWSSFDRGVFLLNALGIVRDPKTGMILIGRRENDPHIKQLSWTFPGGRPAYDKDLEFYLKHEIKIKTGLDVDVNGVVFAKTYPENRNFLAIYYDCEVTGGTAKAGEKFVEVKWIRPTEVRRYFTTSLHPVLLAHLTSMEGARE